MVTPSRAGNSTSFEERQFAHFDELWSGTLQNAGSREFLTPNGAELFWTIIFRLPSQTWHASPLLDTYAQLQKVCSRHRFYSDEQLHLTVVGLGLAAAWRDELSELRRILKSTTERCGKIRPRLCGLNILNDTIIAQVIDTSGELAKLSAELTRHCQTLDGKSSFSASLHEELWWITLARLAASPSEAELAFISSHRRSEFGQFDLSRLALTETNRTFDLERTQLIYEVSITPEAQVHASELE